MIQISDPPLPQGTAQTQYWTGLPGSSLSLALANAVSKADAPLLLICADNEMVEQSIRELRYFCSNSQLLDSADNSPTVLSLPDWETLPYDNFSPHQDIVSDRLNALFHLPNLDRGVLVVSISSLMHRLVPRAYVLGNSLDLKLGQQLDIEQMRRQLVLAGYASVDAVNEHGEFAVRGSILDVFPMGSDTPYRIDLFDDEIETLRTFDPETQRSQQQVDEIRLLPGHEYRLDAKGIAAFRSRFQELFDIDLRQCPLYQDVSDGINSPGLEYYLALFHEQLDNLFDFLPDNMIVCRRGDLKQAGERFWRDIQARYEDRQIDRFRPILKPDAVFLHIDDVLAKVKAFRQIEIRQHPSASDFAISDLPDLSNNPRQQNPLESLTRFISSHGGKVLFCAESSGRRETLLELLRHSGIAPQPCKHWQEFLESESDVGIVVAPLDRGLCLPQGLALITETQLFGNRVAQRRRRARSHSNSDQLIKSLGELHIDDAVVHVDHGVGRYRGLQTITTDGQATEFLTLEYANNAKLYVPVASLHLINRYSGGDSDVAPINQLGTDHWQRTRRKAAEKIRDAAAELLEIYAKRQARQGVSYTVDDLEYEKFAAAFPFEETADQEHTIAAVLDDLRSDQPMDRLVCGDVGFGKTEVAMRAAFVAVQNGKQVAILVPTTLLAQQHFESFKDRFADWPVVVDVISRFKSAEAQKASLERVKQGSIDVLIGTHKLLFADIDYKNLGLLIIDEEHRFGVRQKEKLKALRSNVDILTLTATPIPRTLNLALSEIRDLSLIVTPPAKRLSVKTFVREHQDSLIKEAVSP